MANQKVKARIFFEPEKIDNDWKLSWGIYIPDSPISWKKIRTEPTIDFARKFCNKNNLDWKVVLK